MCHLEATVLVETGSVLGPSELIECARASAEVLLLPRSQIQLRFRTRAAVDLSCTTAGLAAVAGATSSARYSTAAACSRLWFHGRNTASQPVYEAQRDMVYDGIDRLHLSRDSGADSNIERAAGTARLNVVPSRQPSG